MNDDEGQLDTAAVGQLLAISHRTVVRYLNESKPGKRYQHHPFPEPDGRKRGQLYWLSSRREEFWDWDAGRVGTGYHLAQQEGPQA